MAKSHYSWETIKDEELKEYLPCPFCGEFSEDKQNFLAKITDKNGYKSIRCDGCLTQPEFHVINWELAKKHWNSRVEFSESQEFQAGIEYFKRYLIDLIY
jgi:hypothetical protein